MTVIQWIEKSNKEMEIILFLKREPNGNSVIEKWND